TETAPMAPRNQSRMLVLADNDEDEDDDYDEDEDDDTDEDDGDDEPPRMNKGRTSVINNADQLVAQVSQLSKNQRDLALALGTIAKAQKRILRLAEYGA